MHLPTRLRFSRLQNFACSFLALFSLSALAAVAAPPALQTQSSTRYVTENFATTNVDHDIYLNDDSSGITSATVSITSNYQNGQDVLEFTNQLGITGSWSAGTGVLTLSGAASTNDYQTALRAVLYKNASENPADITRTVTFAVTDSDGETGSATRDLHIFPTNDSPVNTDPGPQAIDEDDTLYFSSGMGNQIQISDVDASSGAMKITLSVTRGTLTLAGTTGLSFTTGDGTSDASMVFTGTLTNINNALATLTYHPVLDYFGSDTLTLVTNDQGNTGSGGAKSDTENISITVNPVNDAPVANDDLASTADLTPLDIWVMNNDRDPDNEFHELTVTILSNTLGSSATVNPDNSINFDPGANSGVQTVTYQLTDPDGLTSSIATLTINVGPNTQPGTSSTSVTTDEDTPYTFQAGDFPFSDPDGGQTLAGIIIHNIPADGTLTLSGIPVHNSQTILVGDIGSLVFTPASGASGTPYTSFTFSVQDNLGAYSPSQTFTINVADVNDVPTEISLSKTKLFQTAGLNAVVGTLSTVDSDDVSFSYTLVAGAGDTHNASFNIAGSSLRANDASALTAGTYSVRIQTDDGRGGTHAQSFSITVSDGVFTWSGRGFHRDWSIPENWEGLRIPEPGGNLVFPPNVATGEGRNNLGQGIVYHSITIAAGGYDQGQDSIQLEAGVTTTNGGGGWLGMDITLLNAQSFDVSTGGTLLLVGKISGSQALTKTGAGTLALINGTDHDYTGTTNVDEGTLLLAARNNAVAVGTALNIAAGATVKFAEDGFAGETITDGQIDASVSVTIDEGGTLDLNDRAGTINGLTLKGGRVLTATSGELVLGGNITSQTTASDVSSTIEGFGTLNFNGNIVEVSVSDDIDVADDLNISATIANGTLYKTSSGTLTLAGTNMYTGGTTVSAGTLNVTGSTASGGIVVAPAAALGGTGTIAGHVTINSTATLSPGVDGAGTLTMDSLTLSSGSIMKIDINDTTPGTDFDQVISLGAVDLSGAVLQVALGFTPPHNGSAFQLISAGGGAISGTFTGLSQGAITTISGEKFAVSYTGGDGNDFVLTGNTAPTGTNKTITTNEDTAYTFVASDFGFSDADSGDSLSAVRINSIPSDGSLTLSSVAVTASQVIVAADIGNLVFTPAANANGNGYTGFSFSVRDQSSTYDPSPNAITINVTAVNDAPSGADKTITTDEDTAHTFSASDFGFSDIDGGDTLSAVRIDTLPGAGSLTLSGAAVTASQVIVAGNIGNLRFTPAANASGASYASFTFSVRDQSSVYDPSPNTITIDVTAVNDTPTFLSLSPSTVNQSSGTNAVIGTFTTTDVDDSTFTYALVSGGGDTDNASFNISGSTLRANDALALPGGIYAARFSTTDSSNATFEKNFVITVVDDVAPNAPTAFSATPSGTTVALAWTNPVSDFHSVTIRRSTSGYPSSASNGTAVASGVTTTTQNETGLADGDYYYAIFARDAAGNFSTAATATATVDTTPPTTTIASASLSSDTGSSATDLITATPAQTISGTLSANLLADETVQVSLDNGSTWSSAAASVGSNTWSLAGQTLTGSNTLQVRVIDAATNAGIAFTQPYVLDTTAPITTIASAAFSADTGTSSTDLITRTASQTLSGTLNANLAAGEIVEVSIDNGSTWTTTTSTVGMNSWSLSGQTLTSSNTLKIRVTDTAGNNGTTFSRAYVLDTTAPTAEIASAAFSADTGLSSTDFITATAAQTISGTVSANMVSDEIVEVSLNNGSTWTTATSSVGSTLWSLSGQTLTGSDTLAIRVADTAGNISTTFSHAYALDTSAPNAPSTPDLDSGSDTGLSNTDNITSDTTPTLSSTAENNATVTLYDTDGTTVLNTTTANGSGNWSIASSTLSSGAHTITAKATDTAGNVSSASPGLSITIDTTSPVVTSASVPANASYGIGQHLDFTVNFAENVTIDTSGGTPSLALSLDTGGTVNAFYLSGSGTSALVFRYTVASGHIDSDGVTPAGSITTNGGTLSDTAGNSATLTLNSVGSTTGVLVDGVAPTISSIVRTGASATINAASIDYTVTFSETVTGVDTSDFSLTPSGTAAGAIASISGSTSTYTVTVNSVTGDGTLRLDLKSSGTGIADSATNAISGGYTSGQTYTIDSTATSAPTNFSAVANGSTIALTWTNPAAGDFASSTLRRSSTAYPTSVTDGSSVASGLTGTSHNDTGLSDGAYYYSLFALDTAGNISGAAQATATVDTVAPTAPVIVAISDDTGTSNNDQITTDTTLSLSGTAEAGSTVKVYRNTTLIGSTPADGTGAWTFDYTGTTLAGGTHSFTATSTDAANNISIESTTFLVEIDTATPSAPVITGISNDTGASATDGITNDATLVFTGTAEANTKVTLSRNGLGVIGTVTATSGGAWTFDYSATTLPDGTYLFTAFANDTAGNTSTASADFPVTIDTSAPAIGTQPVGGTYTALGSFALSVTATDATALTYQWYQGATALTNNANRTGSTTAALNHTNISPVGFPGSYTVAITDLAGNTTTSTAAVIVVNKADQTITFPVIADKLTTAAPFALTATASSSFTVTYAVTSGPATIAGNTVTITGAGSVTIRASQAGDVNYNSAFTDRTFTVTKAVATVVILSTPNTYDALAHTALTATTPGGLTVAVTYDGSSTAPVNAGTYAVVATINDATYQGTASGTLTIAKADQLVTFPSVGTLTVGTPVTLTATANTGLPVTFSVVSGNATLSGTSLTVHDANPLLLRATQSGNTNYNPATADRAVTNIVKLSQTITFAALADKSRTAAPFALSATATSSLPVSFTVQSGPATLSGNTLTLTGAAGVVTVVAHQTGNDAYSAATDVSRSFTVSADYPAPVADGFAASVTGGAGSSSLAVTVSTAADFRTHAEATAPAVITVVGTLNLGASTVAVKSNKTIQGADGSSTLIGNLSLSSGVNNVIVRGLNLTNPGTTITGNAYSDGGDAITLTGATGVFITHCSFFDTADHALKITGGSNNITASWNEFYYTSAQTVHRHSVLIGAAGSESAPLRVSLHHNYWSTGVTQNMPAATFGYVHLYNNVFATPGNTTGTEALDQSQLLNERNIYTNVASPLTRRQVNSALAIGRILAIGDSYTAPSASPGTAPYGGMDAVFTPGYSYEMLPTSDVVTVVTAHAGNNTGANITDAATGSATITGPTAAITAGNALTLTAVPSGITPTSYQWRLNNVTISGATSATYTTPSAQESHAGIYTVAISLATGDLVISRPFIVTINPAPVTPPPTPASSGGGGSPSWGFLGALLLLSAHRLHQQRRQTPVKS
ncbi:hypothetical protein CMV30_06930 [Nibricoccus aquaticus]|uniref:Cadherin domain-containing protein n=1 Tax=Nibricoccus aquaticus TaxID=2576891 RepID=A0A290QEF2_9BACT|nr:Ig-like domain-containing protein [Nibricoccus aquaticus]ATC63708.1 hypothetical protein CMV30_06930 [Nibricoccus aquaticus]